jgi:hypothetical protein
MLLKLLEIKLRLLQLYNFFLFSHDAVTTFPIRTHTHTQTHTQTQTNTQTNTHTHKTDYNSRVGGNLISCSVCPRFMYLARDLVHGIGLEVIFLASSRERPPLWSSGQSSVYRSRGPGSIPGVYFLRSSGSGIGSTQPREYN